MSPTRSLPAVEDATVTLHICTNGRDDEHPGSHCAYIIVCIFCVGERGSAIDIQCRPNYIHYVDTAISAQLEPCLHDFLHVLTPDTQTRP